ncbi:MAG: FIST C-terminal domain-containing protein [Alphaproteobacteria bacterium]|nr:FIST C-terminal domain-containing protein [Alphaproteobacteria bacterium]
MTAGADIAFRAAHAEGGGWGNLVKSCLERLMPLPDGANLGFLYATDALAGDLTSILTFLRERTRIANWVGSVGMGICATGVETFGEPGLAVMVAALPPEAFQVFAPVAGDLDRFDQETKDWIARHHPVLGVVHGDPRQPELTETIAALTARSSAFLVGGLSSAQTALLQIAGRVVDGGISGVLLAPEIAVAAGLSQGCSPIGPVRHVSEADGNVILGIDGRPALDIFKEDIGELLSRDLRRIAGLIFAGFPIAGSDTGDYLVRNLVAIDVENRCLAVAHEVAAGDPVLFCRRDTPSAVTDLRRMLDKLKQRAGGSPRGGLYFSCVGRGRNLFGADSEELGLIREVLGDFPLVGFFGNGEISNDRLYGYTGVLTLFL